MDPNTYAKYCNERKRAIKTVPNYPRFNTSWGPALIFGVCIGLVVGVWKYFFPAPDSVFDTIGAVMFTLFYCGLGATIGLILAPLLHFGKKLVIFIKNQAKNASRTKRLAQNPIVLEVLKYAADKTVRAIIVTESGIRLYDNIPDADYCQDETDSYIAHTTIGLDTFEQSFRKKPHWSAYDKGFSRQFLFKEAGFADMDDDTQIALVNYLCNQLGDWGVAKHRAYAFYTTSSGGGWNGKLTFNPHTNTLTAHRNAVSFDETYRDFYKDYLVYHLKSAYQTAIRQAESNKAAQSGAPKQW